jgi:predicted PurR-regulated permease PerM
MKTKEYVILGLVVVVGVLVANTIHDKFIAPMVAND